MRSNACPQQAFYAVRLKKRFSAGVQFGLVRQGLVNHEGCQHQLLELLIAQVMVTDAANSCSPVATGTASAESIAIMRAICG